MLRIVSLLYSLISATLAGTGVIIVLTVGIVSLPAILGAAALVFVLAAPAAWIVARRLYGGPTG